MKYLAFIFLIFLITISNAQNVISKYELQMILKESLQKSRNMVSTANNNWSYDNTNDDYYKNDTIVLNSARSFSMDCCRVINWSFYENERCVIENANYCNEPPTKLISKKEDYVTLEIIELCGETYVEQNNLNGILDRFKIIEFLRNKPRGIGEEEFDYTLKLFRIRK
ncbi:hypothetical protein [Chryseobacterium sp. CFBP8996]|uniref:hypothetical protein n=1 Tax=Chryseobacterium sp. CFBP8996 TaxID=3096529 RepID=UPI002A6A532A|nr:hypothetical protein [Chryseobacterium sp. CFBP8996]MDY0932401.1 hypothetical protein [Chryseobacterium sp. CFBP8996]